MGKGLEDHVILDWVPWLVSPYWVPWLLTRPVMGGYLVEGEMGELGREGCEGGTTAWLKVTLPENERIPDFQVLDGERLGRGGQDLSAQLQGSSIELLACPRTCLYHGGSRGLCTGSQPSCPGTWSPS